MLCIWVYFSVRGIVPFQSRVVKRIQGFFGFVELIIWDQAFFKTSEFWQLNETSSVTTLSFAHVLLISTKKGLYLILNVLLHFGKQCQILLGPSNRIAGSLLVVAAVCIQIYGGFFFTHLVGFYCVTSILRAPDVFFLCVAE